VSVLFINASNVELIALQLLSSAVYVEQQQVTVGDNDNDKLFISRQTLTDARTYTIEGATVRSGDSETPAADVGTCSQLVEDELRC